MKEIPLLMKSDLAYATHVGIKTETRRIIKPQPIPSPARMQYYKDNIWWPTSNSGKIGIFDPVEIKCPVDVGDHYWIREAYYAFGWWEQYPDQKSGKLRKNFIDSTISYGHSYMYCGSHDKHPGLILTERTNQTGWYKRNSLFMPREASRTTVKVVNINAEKVQDITEEGAIAEGIKECRCDGGISPHYNIRYSENKKDWYSVETAKEAFKELWNSINEKRGHGWDKNNYVWVIKFRKI